MGRHVVGSLLPNCSALYYFYRLISIRPLGTLALNYQFYARRNRTQLLRHDFNEALHSKLRDGIDAKDGIALRFDALGGDISFLLAGDLSLSGN